jgi:hypothetical protein
VSLLDLYDELQKEREHQITLGNWEKVADIDDERTQMRIQIEAALRFADALTGKP